MLVLVMFMENRFIYFPEKKWDAVPKDYGLTAEDISLVTRDSEKLHAWFIKADPEEAVLLFFHGNAGNVSHRLDKIAPLVRSGISVFLLEYRGYGKSTGKPTEEGLYLDAEASYQELVSNQNVDPSRLFLFGESIGGAVAIQSATQHQYAGIILEATFTSVKDMASTIIPLLPIHMILKSKYDSIAKIDKINTPLLFIQGDRDEIVPYRLGQKLFKAAKEPKAFYSIPGAHHNDTYVRGGQHYYDRILEFIKTPK